MKATLQFTLGVLASLFLAQPAIAQQLRLFEEPDADPSDQVTMIAGPEQVFNQGSGQPAYTLRSISRFGDRYEAILVTRSGEMARVNWNAGETAPVANTGFTVVASGSSSSVSLMHPPGDGCVSSEPVGVSCSAGNRSELRLVIAVPLASNGVAATTQGQQDQFFVGNGQVGPNPGSNELQVMEGQQVFINPFSGEAEVLPQISEAELRVRQQRQEQRAQRLRQFEQERIDDADIPANMQRVRTPFGDRLMPVRE